MKEVLLIRHGATEGNLQRRYIGRTDEPLCGLGLEQARSLSGLAADRIYASPAVRTVQTAQIIFPDMDISLEPALWEMDFGAFEGKTAQELESDPRYQAWVDAECKTPVPEGEAVDAFKGRCCSAFQKIMAAAPEGSCTAFVIHGGCIMAILEAFAEPKRSFYEWHIRNGGCCRCVMEQGVLQVQ